jgi:hypothetical protein
VGSEEPNLQLSPISLPKPTSLLRRVNPFQSAVFLSTLDISNIGILVNAAVVAAFSWLSKKPKLPLIRGAL